MIPLTEQLARARAIGDLLAVAVLEGRIAAETRRVATDSTADRIGRLGASTGLWRRIHQPEPRDR
jgi:hypothetical protein